MRENLFEIIYITLRDNKRSLIYKDYLKSINLIAKPFYGYDYRKVSDLNEYNDFSKPNFIKRNGRKPKSSEIGCSLSHFNAIKFSDKNKPLIILEDDTLLKVSTKEFLRIVRLFQNNQKYEIILFGFSKCDEVSDSQLNVINPFIKTINLNEINCSIGERLIHTTSGALGYYVSPSAKKKISSLKTIYHLADDWDFYSKIGIKIGYLYPSIVIEDLNQESTLGHNEYYFRQKKYQNKFLNNLLILRRYLIGFFRRTILTLKILFLDN